MGWFGKLTFGYLGLFLGGPLGAIAGAALGHHLVDKKRSITEHTNHSAREPKLKHAEQAQATYFISLFSILGKLAKIDGVVTRDEIVVVEHFLNNLHIAEREKQFAKQVFNEAKNSRYSIEDFAIQLYQTNKQQPTILLSFISLLCQVAAADGKFHPAEEAALRRIKDIFGISDKHYKMLNCTPQSSNQEIKSSYKELVKDFHPDTIVSKGLPEEFTDFATKRFREIQGAYEKIRQERNF
jgi:DnaJ like chaperone protein